MKYFLLSISILWLGVLWCSGHSLSKILLKQPTELVYKVREDEDGKTLMITSPNLKIPTLREIIYYHMIEKPYGDKKDIKDATANTAEVLEDPVPQENAPKGRKKRAATEKVDIPIGPKRLRRQSRYGIPAGTIFGPYKDVADNSEYDLDIKENVGEDCLFNVAVTTGNEGDSYGMDLNGNVGAVWHVPDGTIFGPNNDVADNSEYFSIDNVGDDGQFNVAVTTGNEGNSYDIDLNGYGGPVWHVPDGTIFGPNKDLGDNSEYLSIDNIGDDGQFNVAVTNDNEGDSYGMNLNGNGGAVWHVPDGTIFGPDKDVADNSEYLSIDNVGDDGQFNVAVTTDNEGNSYGIDLNGHGGAVWHVPHGTIFGPDKDVADNSEYLSIDNIGEDGQYNIAVTTGNEGNSYGIDLNGNGGAGWHSYPYYYFHVNGLLNSNEDTNKVNSYSQEDTTSGTSEVGSDSNEKNSAPQENSTNCTGSEEKNSASQDNSSNGTNSAESHGNSWSVDLSNSASVANKSESGENNGNSDEKNSGTTDHSGSDENYNEYDNASSSQEDCHHCGEKSEESNEQPDQLTEHNQDINNKIDQILTYLHDIFMTGNSTIVLPLEVLDKDKNVNVLEVLHNISNIENNKDILTPGVIVNNGYDPNKHNMFNVLKGLFINLFKNNIIINNSVPVSSNTTDKNAPNKDKTSTTDEPTQIDQDTSLVVNFDENIPVVIDNSSIEYVTRSPEKDNPVLAVITSPDGTKPDDIQPEKEAEPKVENSTAAPHKNDDQNNKPTENCNYDLANAKKSDKQVKNGITTESNDHTVPNKTEIRDLEDVGNSDKNNLLNQTTLPENDDYAATSDTNESENPDLNNEEGIYEPYNDDDHILSNETEITDVKYEHNNTPNKTGDVIGKNPVTDHPDISTEATKSPIEESREHRCRVGSNKDNCSDKDETKLDYMLDLVNNKKFWDVFMGDLAAKYLESLTDRTTKNTKVEISAQRHKHNEEHKQKTAQEHIIDPEIDQLPHKTLHEIEKDNYQEVNGQKSAHDENDFSTPDSDENYVKKYTKDITQHPVKKNKLGVTEKAKNDGIKYNNEINVKAHNVYGNTVGNDKVTNVFIFYANTKIEDIMKNIKNLVNVSSNTDKEENSEKGKVNIKATEAPKLTDWVTEPTVTGEKDEIMTENHETATVVSITMPNLPEIVTNSVVTENFNQTPETKKDTLTSNYAMVTEPGKDATIGVINSSGTVGPTETSDSRETTDSFDHTTANTAVVTDKDGITTENNEGSTASEDVTESILTTVAELESNESTTPFINLETEADTENPNNDSTASSEHDIASTSAVNENDEVTTVISENSTASGDATEPSLTTLSELENDEGTTPFISSETEADTENPNNDTTTSSERDTASTSVLPDKNEVTTENSESSTVPENVTDTILITVSEHGNYETTTSSISSEAQAETENPNNDTTDSSEHDIANTAVVLDKYEITNEISKNSSASGDETEPILTTMSELGNDEATTPFIGLETETNTEKPDKDTTDTTDSSEHDIASTSVLPNKEEITTENSESPTASENLTDSILTTVFELGNDETTTPSINSDTEVDTENPNNDTTTSSEHDIANISVVSDKYEITTENNKGTTQATTATNTSETKVTSESSGTEESSTNIAIKDTVNSNEYATENTKTSSENDATKNEKLDNSEHKDSSPKENDISKGKSAEKKDPTTSNKNGSAELSSERTDVSTEKLVEIKDNTEK